MSLEDTEKKVKGATSSLNEFTAAVSSVGEAVDRMTHLGSQASAATGGMTNAFSDLAETTKDFTGVFTKSIEAVFSVLSIAPLASGAFESLGKSISIVGTATDGLIDVMGSGLKAAFDIFDAPSRDIRGFADDMFDLNKRFGGTIDQAFSFADALKKETMSDFSRSLHLTKDQMADFASATARTNINLEQQGKIVETGIGKTTLLAAATALASASGITAAEGASLLNTALNKQGKSAQDALEMMAAFGGVSRETGLSIDDVSSTLNSAVGNFTKLGISADFGIPLLQGFSRVMLDMGLGIENATDLTSGLASALAGLTTDYANAYIMFQRGGLEIGGSAGGGALGASIGLQAAVLDAEKTGSQAELGAELAKGMRDTLASFTGGEIVTVEQAAESPELQTQFYTQQQLLQNQFGIRDAASANRTLDLLAQLDEATRTGNMDAKGDLEKQLMHEKEGRDQTLDEFEKANRHLAAQSNLLAVIAAPTLLKQRGGAELLRMKADDLVAKGGEAARGSVDAYDEHLSTILGFMGAGETPAEMAAMAASVAAEAEPRPPVPINEPGPSNPDLNGLAGYASGEEFIQALATAIEGSQSKNLTVNITMSENAKGILEASASLSKQATGTP
jgi:hypothetical protein